MFKFLRKLFKDRGGNALAIAAAAMPLLVGSAGLATDTIQWTLWKRQLQRAADSAAFAGAYASVQNAVVSSAVNRDLTENQKTGISLKSGYPKITYPSGTGYTSVVKVELAIEKKLSFSSASAAISRSSRRIAGVRSIERKKPERVWLYDAAMTFSRTVMFRNSRSVWKVRPIPRPAISCDVSPTMLCPSSRMSPASGR